MGNRKSHLQVEFTGGVDVSYLLVYSCCVHSCFVTFPLQLLAPLLCCCACLFYCNASTSSLSSWLGPDRSASLSTPPGDSLVTLPYSNADDGIIELLAWLQTYLFFCFHVVIIVFFVFLIKKNYLAHHVLSASFSVSIIIL